MSDSETSNLEQFLHLHGNERFGIVIREILTELTRVGGVATRAELRRGLRENAEAIPEEYFAYTKPSASNSSGTYRPFDFDFYMAINDLLVTGFLEEPTHGQLQLTAQGRAISIENFDVHRNVILAANRLRAEARRKNKELKQQKGVESEEVSEAEQTSDTVPDADSSDGESSWRSQLADAIARMSPHKFEVFSRALVAKMGVTIDKELGVADSHDGGIDGYGYIQSDAFETSRIAIQAKHWDPSHSVSAPDIDQFRGAIDKFHAEYGIYITSSTFTRGAEEAARAGSSVITLIDGEKIIDLVAKFHLYVHPVTTYVLDDFYKTED
jgi:restriction system protein